MRAVKAMLKTSGDIICASGRRHMDEMLRKIASRMSSGREEDYKIIDKYLTELESTGSTVTYVQIDQAVREEIGSWKNISESTRKFIENRIMHIF